MKKRLSQLGALLLCCLLLTSGAGTAFAAGEGVAGNLKAGAHRWGQGAQVISGKAITVESNQMKITSLKQSLVNQIRILKAEVRKLRQQNKKLTPAQTDKVKAALAAVKATHQNLKNCRETLRQQLQALRTARKNKDLNGFIGALDQVTATQRQEITLLQSTIEQLKSLELSLKETGATATSPGGV